jgi:hypothetical protein
VIYNAHQIGSGPVILTSRKQDFKEIADWSRVSEWKQFPFHLTENVTVVSYKTDDSLEVRNTQSRYIIQTFNSSTEGRTYLMKILR